MNHPRVFGVIACLGVASSTYLAGVASADQGNLMTCIKQFTSMGISPDAALGECKKSTLATCVQNLMGKKYEAGSIKYIEPGTMNGAEARGGYLIDLGNTESRWLEGKQWVERGCVAYTKGPYKRQSDNISTFWGNQRSYEWFRQGLCVSNKVELDQPYSAEEAKLRCELGDLSVPRAAAPSKPN